MLTPTRLVGPITDRDADVFDLAVIEAMLVQALGPESDAIRLHREGSQLHVDVSPLGRATLQEMAVTVNPVDIDGWMEILAPGLVEDAVGEVGEDWRAEAELAVELLAAERSDEMGALARLAAAGPLVIPADTGIAAIMAQVICSPLLVLLV